jgi:hypothetical protein
VVLGAVTGPLRLRVIITPTSQAGGKHPFAFLLHSPSVIVKGLPHRLLMTLAPWKTKAKLTAVLLRLLDALAESQLVASRQLPRSN